MLKLCIIIYKLYISRAAQVAQACHRKRDRLWVRYPLEEVKYYYFFRYGFEEKSKVEFHHSPRNVSRIPWKVESGVFEHIKLLLFTLLNAKYIVKLKKKRQFLNHCVQQKPIMIFVYHNREREIILSSQWESNSQPSLYNSCSKTVTLISIKLLIKVKRFNFKHQNKPSKSETKRSQTSSPA